MQMKLYYVVREVDSENCEYEFGPANYDDCSEFQDQLKAKDRWSRYHIVSRIWSVE